MRRRVGRLLHTVPVPPKAWEAQRKGQFFIDLVEAENSVGFHAPGEEMRILNQALDAIRKGQVAIRSRTSH